MPYANENTIQLALVVGAIVSLIDVALLIYLKVKK